MAQAKAREVLRSALGNKYAVALADMPTTPDWLTSFGAAPMYLGLDLRGGVHFLLQVDMQAAQQRAEENYEDDLKKLFQGEKVRYLSVKRDASGRIQSKFKTEELRDQALGLMLRNTPELETIESEQGDRYLIKRSDVRSRHSRDSQGGIEKEHDRDS